MSTYGDLFTGFGGATLGAMAAGLTPLWGVEHDPKIAAVANDNLGGHVRVVSVLDCDPSAFEPVDVMHGSPPCPSFSVAKTGGKETDLDIALARKTAEFVTVLMPRIFTLENVWAYRKSESWRIVEDALYGAGYWLHMEHINCADFGVPQTRKRMIVRAVRGGWVPTLPQPEPWVGWYAAIVDLIDDLPKTKFAPWQLKRLPDELRTALYGSGGYGGNVVNVDATDPTMTITANPNQLLLRAYLITQQSTNDEGAPQCRAMDEPCPTVMANTKGATKAFWMRGNNAGSNDHGSKAYIVDCQGAGNSGGERGLTIRNQDEPVFTMTSTMLPKRPARAMVGGRVVSMTPRCLARFQTIPDWYELPANKTLAAKGIGNAVPPLLMQRLYKQLLD